MSPGAPGLLAWDRGELTSWARPWCPESAGQSVAPGAASGLVHTGRACAPCRTGTLASLSSASQPPSRAGVWAGTLPASGPEFCGCHQGHLSWPLCWPAGLLRGPRDCNQGRKSSQRATSSGAQLGTPAPEPGSLGKRPLSSGSCLQPEGGF